MTDEAGKKPVLDKYKGPNLRLAWKQAVAAILVVMNSEYSRSADIPHTLQTEMDRNMELLFNAVPLDTPEDLSNETLRKLKACAQNSVSSDETRVILVKAFEIAQRRVYFCQELHKELGSRIQDSQRVNEVLSCVYDNIVYTGFSPRLSSIIDFANPLTFPNRAEIQDAYYVARDSYEAHFPVQRLAASVS